MQTLDDVGRPDALPGSRDWIARMRLHIDCQIAEAKSTVSNVRFELKEMRDGRHYTKLQDRDGNDFATWEDFCQYKRPYGLGIPTRVADAIIGEPDDNRRIAHVASEVMARAAALADHGGDRKSVDQGAYVTLKRGTNSAPYLAARIKRDRPDIAAAVEAGEYRSMRQAAIAAGIIKEKTRLDKLMAAWRAASEEERRKFLASVQVDG